MTFAQVLRFSLDHAPLIITAQSGVSSAEAQKLASVAAFLPTLSINEEPAKFRPLIGGAGNSVISGIVVPNGRGYELNVAAATMGLTLFAGGKNRANYEASIDSLRAANHELTAALGSCFGQLLEDFAAIAADQITARTQAKLLNIYENLVILANSRMQGKVASRIDLIQVQQQMLQTQLQLSQARQQLTTDREKLYADMGSPQIGTSELLEEWLPDAPTDMSRAVSIEDDPAVASAGEAVESARKKVKATRGEYAPTISLAAQYNLLGISPSSVFRAIDDTHPNSYYVGIAVTVPILPLLNVRADIDAAKANVRNLEGQYQGALATAANRVFDASDKLKEARTGLQTANQSADLAEQNVRLVQDSFLGRQSDERDVDNSKALLLQAEQSRSIADLKLRTATWEWFRAQNANEFPATLLKAVAEKQSVDEIGHP